ncbi:uncharacterized protein IL334_005604 [Kwoniella shivajii]|uniref:F-box domain-containing protein n=1 Tax=Kwoniella shivajii TaxID=564305 RepID=A0ABZ1D457_9TREE|nr:hypothetical protein IL334_005604 [Kwoniella shivajii]
MSYIPVNRRRPTFTIGEDYDTSSSSSSHSSIRSSPRSDPLPSEVEVTVVNQELESMMSDYEENPIVDEDMDLPLMDHRGRTVIDQVPRRFFFTFSFEGRAVSGGQQVNQMPTSLVDKKMELPESIHILRQSIREFFGIGWYQNDSSCHCHSIPKMIKLSQLPTEIIDNMLSCIANENDRMSLARTCSVALQAYCKRRCRNHGFGRPLPQRANKTWLQVWNEVIWHWKTCRTPYCTNIGRSLSSDQPIPDREDYDICPSSTRCQEGCRPGRWPSQRNPCLFRSSRNECNLEEDFGRIRDLLRLVIRSDDLRDHPCLAWSFLDCPPSKCYIVDVDIAAAEWKQVVSGCHVVYNPSGVTLLDMMHSISLKMNQDICDANDNLRFYNEMIDEHRQKELDQPNLSHQLIPSFETNAQMISSLPSPQYCHIGANQLFLHDPWRGHRLHQYALNWEQKVADSLAHDNTDFTIQGITKKPKLGVRRTGEKILDLVYDGQVLPVLPSRLAFPSLKTSPSTPVVDTPFETPFLKTPLQLASIEDVSDRAPLTAKRKIQAYEGIRLGFEEDCDFPGKESAGIASRVPYRRLGYLPLTSTIESGMFGGKDIDMSISRGMDEENLLGLSSFHEDSKSAVKVDEI